MPRAYNLAEHLITTITCQKAVIRHHAWPWLYPICERHIGRTQLVGASLATHLTRAIPYQHMTPGQGCISLVYAPHKEMTCNHFKYSPHEYSSSIHQSNSSFTFINLSIGQFPPNNLCRCPILILHSTAASIHSYFNMKFSIHDGGKKNI